MMDPAAERARALVRAGQRRAEEERRQIAAQTPLTQEFFRLHLRRYVLCKFLLAEEDPEEEDLTALARQSLAKSMGLSRELAFLQDTSAGCSSAGSVDTKLALLLMALQKDLGLSFPLAEAVRASTLPELAGLLWQTMEKDPGWQDRLARPDRARDSGAAGQI